MSLPALLLGERIPPLPTVTRTFTVSLPPDVATLLTVVALMVLPLTTSSRLPERPNNPPFMAIKPST